jgi:hypothetical protein
LHEQRLSSQHRDYVTGLAGKLQNSVRFGAAPNPIDEEVQEACASLELFHVWGRTVERFGSFSSDVQDSMRGIRKPGPAHPFAKVRSGTFRRSQVQAGGDIFDRRGCFLLQPRR